VEAQWRIELLGGVRAIGAGVVVDRFRTQKTAALLALLAFPPGRSRSRDELIALFWPDDDLNSARHKLSVALHALRQQLEPEGAAEGSVLRADRFAVSLVSGAIRTDVQEFAEALRDAGKALTDVDRERHLSRALEAYRGEFLAGYYDSWIFPEQGRLTEQFLEGLHRLVALREVGGDLRGALQAALQAVAADPFREELHREVMRLQLAAGQPAEALRQYQLLEARLRLELDTAPSGATRELLREAQTAGVPDAALIPVALPPSPLEATVGRGMSLTLEPPGGAVPLGSPFYVERTADRQLHEALKRGDSIVLLKGPRQSGKTSLLARGLQDARARGAAVVFTDLQGLNAEHLASPDALLLALAEDLCEQLDLEVEPAASWTARLGPSPSFRRYMRREVLGKREGPLVWGLDQIDLLLKCPFATEVFGLFRSWHNERALDPTGPWSGLTMAVAYATEAHLFITDLNQSLFNVGTRLYLADFDLDNLADLNRRYGAPLRSDDEVRRLHDLVGGHPYLVRSAFHDMVTTGGANPLARVEAQADQDEGLFAEPLRRILLFLRHDLPLCEAVREVVRGRTCPTLDSFYSLRSAGVLVGDSMDGARLRCRLFERFLGRHLV
jgi:DNA-binding SARP family transcriptional activator